MVFTFLAFYKEINKTKKVIKIRNLISVSETLRFQSKTQFSEMLIL